MIGSAREQNRARSVNPVVHGNCLPMWIYDRRTLRFLEVSDGAIRMYGYTREEFLAMTVHQLGPIEETAKLQHIDPGSVNGHHRWLHRRKDGRPLSIAINSNALIYEGRLARLVVAREVTNIQLASPKGTAHREPSNELASVAGTTRASKVELSTAEAAAKSTAAARISASRPSIAAEVVTRLPSKPAIPSEAVAVPLKRTVKQEDPKPQGPDDWKDDPSGINTLEEKAAEALDYANRTRQRVAVVCLDLDNLEEVLERAGAEGIERCVEQVRIALTRRLRGMDAVARTGTKTFTILLAELDDDFALHRVAEALLRIFAGPFYVKGHAFGISASIGVAVYPGDGFDLTRLCRAADRAMLQARASGGQRISMFSHQVRERTELDSYMRDAMKRNGFRLYYQPQYSPDGAVCTLEALLRLPGKEAGFISPDLFIPIAEDSGMIEQLGMWVIEQASRQVKAWHREYGRLAHVAVNVSPLQLRGPDFAERALSMIRSHGVVPASIEFEITERAVLNFDEVAEPMRKLSEAGIVFAVDDFGTGYSSLQHLHRLPISVLKIDRSFVQRMGVPEGAEAIIEAIVSMAHSLGMRVVAEGVETQEQRSAATQMGCDSIQGFLHAPAVDASKIPGLMGWLN